MIPSPSSPTRRVELFCQLPPGWQDQPAPALFFSSMIPPRRPGDDTLRVKIIAELPHYGGTADTDVAIESQIKTEPEKGPEPGHEPAEPLPQAELPLSDLVLRTPAPAAATLILPEQIQPALTISSSSLGEPILKLEKDGFFYMGQKIEDAGEAHRLFMECLTGHATPAPIPPPAPEPTEPIVDGKIPAEEPPPPAAP